MNLDMEKLGVSGLHFSPERQTAEMIYGSRLISVLIDDDGDLAVYENILEECGDLDGCVDVTYFDMSNEDEAYRGAVGCIRLILKKEKLRRGW
jgi:hypothetical protein